MDLDARGKANEAIDRRARQRHAAAQALLELTPEAIKAEEERQRKNAALLTGGKTEDDLRLEHGSPKDAPREGYPGRAFTSMTPEQWAESDSVEHAYGETPVTYSVDAVGESALHVLPDDAVNGDLAEAVAAFANEGGLVPDALSDQLAQAMREAAEEAAEPDLSAFATGGAIIQWALVETPESEDGEYQLILQAQVDEQPPSGASFDLTTEMLDRWSEGSGLQKNRTEHKRFAAGLIEKAVELSAFQTGNALIYSLEQILLSRTGDAPTETQVGDADEPEYPELSE
jgi:hypothetical protein